MSDTEATPDLSKIVSAIMEHPELIEQISSLVKSDGEKKSDPTESTDTGSEVISEARADPVSVARPEGNNRKRLLYALKPYLSERRSKAIDSMLTFGDIFDMMKAKS